MNRPTVFDWTPVLKQLATTRALTLRQPWATAVLLGKPVENRGKPLMSDGGLLWLHAGARSRWDPAGEKSPLVRNVWAGHARSRPEAHNSIWMLGKETRWMPFGAIVAMMEIRGCHHSSVCVTPHGAGSPVLCSPWAVDGQYHIEIAAVHPLRTAILCRGWQGLWPLGDDVLPVLRAEIIATAASASA
jgi:hypothetical protein